MQLRSIHIYPIKGTRRVPLDEAVVAQRGLAGDRRWMLVDSEGTFLSQRTRPQMALIRTQPNGEATHVTAPGMPPLTLRQPRDRAAREAVQIWKDAVAAVPAAAEAHAWFSRFLGLRCRLVFMDEKAQRLFDASGAGAGAEVSFADVSPVMLATHASLDALNARLVDAVPMNRFRPNLVVDGTEAFAEDGWKRLRIGEVVFRVVRPVGRCTVTTTDQDTAEVGKEPLRTLATFRKRGDLVYFGVHMIPLSEGVVRVGAAATVEA